MTIIDDIKKSIIEYVRARAPDIPEDNFYPDPPQGNYERPCFYLTFYQTKRYYKAGQLLYQHSFDAVIEVMESQTNVQPMETETDFTKKMRMMEETLQEGNMIPFYHYDEDNEKERREGYIEVKKFSIQEGTKDRQRNSIKGNLTLIY